MNNGNRILLKNSIISRGTEFSNTVEAIIFDLGNVLIDFDHWIVAQRLTKFTDMKAQEMFALFFNSELIGSFEEGRISPIEFFSKVKETLNLKMDYAEFVCIWEEIFFLTKKNIDVYHLARKLKNHYKLTLLSNINILHFEYIKKRFPVFDAFHHIVTSFEIGARKPQPLIYQKTLEMLGVSAGNVFYTDDRPELIESARLLGIKGFVFSGVRQLEKDLLGEGIKIN